MPRPYGPKSACDHVVPLSTERTINAVPPCVLTPISDQIRALEWIFQNELNPERGVKLAAINMSLGGGRFTGACDDAPQKPIIDSLRSAGVATIIAAGNDGFTDSIGSPACISTAIAVGSSDKHDKISSFSNMSPLVKLMAPGGFGFNPDGTSPSCVPGEFNENILSSVSATTAAKINLYDCFSGTSMAAPHVAGAFAALRTVCPDATVDQIVAALQQTGVAIVDNRPGGTQTVPRISVDAARQKLGCVLAAR
jgi:subtilisin family serine protease